MRLLGVQRGVPLFAYYYFFLNATLCLIILLDDQGIMVPFRQCLIVLDDNKMSPK